MTTLLEHFRRFLEGAWGEAEPKANPTPYLLDPERTGIRYTDEELTALWKESLRSGEPPRWLYNEYKRAAELGHGELTLQSPAVDPLACHCYNDGWYVHDKTCPRSNLVDRRELPLCSLDCDACSDGDPLSMLSCPYCGWDETDSEPHAEDCGR